MSYRYIQLSEYFKIFICDTNYMLPNTVQKICVKLPIFRFFPPRKNECIEESRSNFHSFF